MLGKYNKGVGQSYFMTRDLGSEFILHFLH